MTVEPAVGTPVGPEGLVPFEQPALDKATTATQAIDRRRHSRPSGIRLPASRRSGKTRRADGMIMRRASVLTGGSAVPAGQLEGNSKRHAWRIDGQASVECIVVGRALTW